MYKHLYMCASSVVASLCKKGCVLWGHIHYRSDHFESSKYSCMQTVFTVNLATC